MEVEESQELVNFSALPSVVSCQISKRDWYFIAEQPAPAPHRARPEGCAALHIVLVTVPRVSRSCEHFPDRFDLHLPWLTFQLFLGSVENVDYRLRVGSLVRFQEERKRLFEEPTQSRISPSVLQHTKIK